MRTKESSQGLLGVEAARWASDLVVSGQTHVRQQTDRQQRSSLGPTEAGQTKYMPCTATVRGTIARSRGSANSLGRGCGRWLGVMYVQRSFLGPYVAIPGSRQSDDVAARMQVDRCGSQARAGVFARVPQADRKGSCRLAWSVTGKAMISLAVPRLCGREASSQPTATTPWRASL